jgi:hypothetical protein
MLRGNKMDGMKGVINKKTLENLNTQYQRISDLYAEVCKAESAGVPLPDNMKQNCLDMKAAIERFKAVYFTASL